MREMEEGPMARLRIFCMAAPMWLSMGSMGLLIGCEAQVGFDDDALRSTVTGTAGAPGDRSADLPLRAYLEANGWTCDDTTCMAHSEMKQMPDAVFEPFDPDSDDTPSWLPAAPDGVAVTGAALHLPQQTALSRTNRHHSEPDASYFRTDSTSVSSMNVFANQHFTGLTEETTVLAHGCTTSYSAVWCRRGHTLAGAPTGAPRNWKGADPTSIFENVGTNYLHVFTLDNANPDASYPATGFSWYSKSGDPCPASCGVQTWNECHVGLPAGVSNPDFPGAVYDRGGDKKWLIYNAVSGGNNKLVLATFDDGSHCDNGTQYVRPCAGSNQEYFGRAAVDAAGTLHIVYFDYTNGADVKVRYTTFNTTTNTWSCTSTYIDDYDPPSGTACGNPAYAGIGSGLRQNRNATIAVDDTVSPWNSINIVLVSANSVNGLEAQMRWYRKTTDWLPTVFTTANEYHPRIVFDRTPFSALANRYHTISLQDTNSSQNGSTAQVASWVSTNGGLSWNGTLISAAFTPQVLLAGSCYWGDYEAIAADRANGVVFYGWSNPANPWNIQGRGIEE